jgi:serine/threonine protein kinase
MRLSNWSRTAEPRFSTKRVATMPSCGRKWNRCSKVEGQTMGFLRKPVLDAAQQIAAGALSGKRIGAYQLLRLLGEGGMGKVYLAARADDLYQKEVAIKMVQGGLGQNRAMLLRFAASGRFLPTSIIPASRDFWTAESPTTVALSGDGVCERHSGR